MIPYEIRASAGWPRIHGHLTPSTCLNPGPFEKVTLAAKSVVSCGIWSIWSIVWYRLWCIRGQLFDWLVRSHCPGVRERCAMYLEPSSEHIWTKDQRYMGNIWEYMGMWFFLSLNTHTHTHTPTYTSHTQTRIICIHINTIIYHIYNIIYIYIIIYLNHPSYLLFSAPPLVRTWILRSYLKSLFVPFIFASVVFCGFEFFFSILHGGPGCDLD